MAVDGDPVVWSAQAVRSPDPAGRSVAVHTAGKADDMLKVSAGLDDVSEAQSRYEACLVVWYAHIAATGSSTSSDGIALAPDGGPWRSFYRNSVSGRKPFFPKFVFLSPCLFSWGVTLRMRPTKRSGQPQPHGKGRGSRGLDVSDVDCGVCCVSRLYIFPPSVQMNSVVVSRQSLPQCISWICLFARKKGI